MFNVSILLSCFCNCALFVCSSHVEEIKNIIIIILLRSSAMMVLFDVF